MTKKKNKQNRYPQPLRFMRWMYPKLEQMLPGVAHKLSYKMFFSPVRFDRPEREKSIRTKATKFSLVISGKETAFYSWGDEANPLIVLVHGWMGRATQFHSLIEALVSNSYRVIAFDGPAHGESKGRSTDLRDFSAALQNINETYGPIKMAVGHSFGGVAVLYAIEKGLDLENAILISSPSIGDDIIKQFVSQMNGTSATGEAFKRSIKRKFGFEFNELSASHIIKRINLNSLLLVHDYKDNDVPISHAELLKELFPAAKTIFTTGLGHTRILRDQATVEKIVKYIGEEVKSKLEQSNNMALSAAH